jgi:hypothetical protein
MDSLWTNLSFFVIEREAPDHEILASLPVRARVLGVGRRNLALAETIHLGPEGVSNYTEFAVFRASDCTVIAPPGSIFMRNGEPAWLEALSRTFGRCWAFCTGEAVSGVWRFEDGSPVAVVSSDQVDPPDGLLGLTHIEDGEDAPVLAALALLLGTEDLRSLLRNGSCTLCTTTDLP